MTSRAQTARGYRYKPAPRGRRKQRIEGFRWDRAGRIVLVVVLIVIALLYIRPAINLFDTWTDKRAESANAAKLEREQARLEAQLARLKEPGAIEQEARSLGMIAPGERPYAIRGLKD